MPYQPTGRPTGRPRKDGLPAGSTKPDKPAKPDKPVEPEEPAPFRRVPDHPLNAPAGTPKPGPFAICGTCYPAGWPKGATGLGCSHGIWARPWIPGH